MSLLDQPNARIGLGIGTGVALGVSLNMLAIFLPLGIVGGILWSRKTER